MFAAARRNTIMTNQRTSAPRNMPEFKRTPPRSRAFSSSILWSIASMRSAFTTCSMSEPSATATTQPMRNTTTAPIKSGMKFPTAAQDCINDSTITSPHVRSTIKNCNELDVGGYCTMHQDSTAHENTSNIRFRETLTPPPKRDGSTKGIAQKNDLAHLLLYMTPLPRPRALVHNALHHPQIPPAREWRPGAPTSLLEQLQLPLHLVDLVEQRAELFCLTRLIHWGWGAGDSAERLDPRPGKRSHGAGRDDAFSPLEGLDR